MRITISYAALLGGATSALAALGVLALPPALAALGQVRGRFAEAQRLATAPAAPPPKAVAGALAASSEPQAREMLRLVLQRQAVVAGVLAEAIEPVAEVPDGVVCDRIAASGDGRALLRFAAAVEAGGLARFRHWRLARPNGNGAMRLSGEVVARWDRR